MRRVWSWSSETKARSCMCRSTACRTPLSSISHSTDRPRRGKQTATTHTGREVPQHANQ